MTTNQGIPPLNKNQFGVTIQDWLDAVRANGGRPDTIRVYRGHLNVVRKLLPDAEISAFSLRRFFNEYRDGSRSEHTVAAVWRSLHAFLRFAADEGLIEPALVTAVKRPDPGRPKKPTYSKGQLTALIRLLEGNRSPLGRRDHALVALLIATGMRAGEASRAKLSDLKDDGCLWLGETKTGEDRLIPLSPKARAILHNYLAVGRPKMKPKTERIFVSRYGTAITSNTIRNLMNRLETKLGFELRAHYFRHTFTTEMLRNGESTEKVRRLNGWTTYAMVQQYSHLVVEDLKKAVNQNSPLENL